MASICPRQCVGFMRHSSTIRSLTSTGKWAGRKIHIGRKINVINSCTKRTSEIFTKPYTTGSDSEFWPDIDAVKDDPLWLKRLFGDDKETQVVTDEERTERESIFARVREMQLAEPPVEPDAAFFRETFEMLMKYNDRYKPVAISFDPHRKQMTLVTLLDTFLKRVFRHEIRRYAVEKIWALMEEMGVEQPEEFICKVEDFLIKARERAWFE